MREKSEISCGCEISSGCEIMPCGIVKFDAAHQVK